MACDCEHDTCDGTWQAYKRLLRRGVSCKQASRAWAERQKQVRARLRREGRSREQ